MTAAAVVLPPLEGQQAQAWDTLMAVAGDLGEGWTLIGGQMVLLHQAERGLGGAGAVGGAGLRWSYDLDVVVNLRTSRSRMSHIDSVLRGHGFEQQVVPIGHRYVDAAGAVFDVLAPDHLGRHLPRLGRGNTLQAPGATQALKRTARVMVEHNQQQASIPRPSLVGALLIKIAAASGPPSGRDPDRHLIDVVTLATLVTPQDVTDAGLTRKERRRIRRAAQIVAQVRDVRAGAAAAALALLAPTSPSDSGGHERDAGRGAAVVCGQRLGPRRWCRRRLTTRPCPDHPHSPGSTTIRARG